MLKLTAAIALLLVIVTGCSQPQPPLPASNPVTGQIVSIKGTTLVLDPGGGENLSFEIADQTVTVDHLRVHQRDHLPVKITWRQNGASLVATIIADA
jgi:hypothetical protein